MKQAIVYARFSSNEQRKGVSIDRQMERTHEMASARGWDVEKVIVDEGKSGFTGKHREEGGALAAFEKEARAGVHAGKVLIVERLSRLSRENPHLSYDLLRALLAGGMWLAVWDGQTVYESIDSLDFMATIEYFLKAKIANEESTIKRDFARDKWKRRRAAARTGVIVTKSAPPWLRKNEGGPYPLGDDRRWSIVDGRDKLIQRIFAESDAGDGSLRIVRRLNAEGIKPWPRYEGRTPREWDRKFITNLLSNPAVIGDWVMYAEDADGKPQPDGEPVRGYFPRIIEPDLFERVCAAAMDRKATMGGGASNAVSNIVAGLLVCQACGGPMEFKRARAKGSVVTLRGVVQPPLQQESGTLYCRSFYRRLGCQNGAGVAYVSFERALIDEALHLALDDSAFERTDEVGRISILIADRKRDHDAATGKAKALWEGYAATQSDMAMKLAMDAESVAKSIDDELLSLRDARNKASGEASATEHLTRLATIREHLNSDDMEVRRVHRLKVAAGLRSIIEKIVCDTNNSATIHFKGGARLVTIKPQRGRRPPTVTRLDLVHPTRTVQDGIPANIAALVKRVKDARGG